MPPSPDHSNRSTDNANSQGDASRAKAKGENSNNSLMDASKWHTLNDFDELAPGEVGEAFVEGTILVLANIEGELHAMDGICAHQGGPLGKGKLVGCVLTCPWHGWQYDVGSGKQILSKVIAQRTYPIRRQNDTIQVYLGDD